MKKLLCLLGIISINAFASGVMDFTATTRDNSTPTIRPNFIKPIQEIQSGNITYTLLCVDRQEVLVVNIYTSSGASISTTQLNKQCNI